MKSYKIFPVIGVSLVMLMVSCVNRSGENELPQSAKKTAPLVKLETAKTSALTAFTDITGTVWPNIVTEVKSPVNGIVEELLSRENQKTEKDKIIAVINPDDRVALISASQLVLEQLEKRIAAAGSDSAVNDSLERALTKAKHDLQYAREMYQPVPVICPMSGIVTSRWVEEGSQVRSGDKLVTISDMNSLVIKAEINETYFEAVAAGKVIPVIFNAYPNDTVNAVISLIYPSVSEETRAVKFDLRPARFTKKLLPGMMAKVRIPVYKNNDALAIHNDALLTTPENRKFIFVVDNDTIAWQRLVETGVTVDSQTEITGGLKAGEKVVVSGQEKLKNNMKVTVTSSSKKIN
ncbi:MAG: efflux RND transporter periplasmic adaptor subunit [Bacteroidales bacterium]|nr:efflux RND transporter periplasmic adaptor subunit [Bacteroidales bacterium]